MARRRLVGFARREFCRDDGDPHRLLLEERHAERLFEDLLQLVRDRVGRRARIMHLLDSLPAAQIGMHHVALDRAGADDRDLDDEVVEFASA